MIRVGSLAGYLFDGPRLLGGWTPPNTPAVYAILYRPDPATKPDRYAVIYVGHTDNLAHEGFPFKHPRTPCWLTRAGSKWKLHIATFDAPGSGPTHRTTIANELTAIYNPHCNHQKYDQTWQPHWISKHTGSANAPPPVNPSAALCGPSLGLGVFKTHKPVG